MQEWLSTSAVRMWKSSKTLAITLLFFFFFILLSFFNNEDKKEKLTTVSVTRNFVIVN